MTPKDWNDVKPGDVLGGHEFAPSASPSSGKAAEPTLWMMRCDHCGATEKCDVDRRVHFCDDGQTGEWRIVSSPCRAESGEAATAYARTTPMTNAQLAEWCRIAADENEGRGFFLSAGLRECAARLHSGDAAPRESMQAFVTRVTGPGSEDEPSTHGVGATELGVTPDEDAAFSAAHTALRDAGYEDEADRLVDALHRLACRVPPAAPRGEEPTPQAEEVRTVVAAARAWCAATDAANGAQEVGRGPHFRAYRDTAAAFHRALNVQTMGLARWIVASAAIRELVADLYPDLAQLLDGWHADGAAWSEWDEDVRRRLSRLAPYVHPAARSSRSGAEATSEDTQEGGRDGNV